MIKAYPGEFKLDYGLKREMDDHWKQSQSLMAQAWVEMDLDTKLATGQQDDWNMGLGNTMNRGQRALKFNKILRVLNMVEGYQRKHRMASIVTPVDSGGDQTAQDFSDAVHWTHGIDNTYEKISESFGGAITCGLNFLNVWMDYREDPENGEIRTTRIPFNAVLTDPYWEKSSLEDCDWIWARRYMTRNQVLSLYPDIDKDLPSMSRGYGAKDGRFQYLAQNWYQYADDVYSYDEYWTREYRKAKRLLDVSTGEMIDWTGDKYMLQLMKQVNPNVRVVEVMRPTVKMHCLVNNHLVYEEIQPFGIDKYPYIPFLCYHFPEVQNYGYRYQGITRNCRSSQIELNHRRNSMLSILDSQVQSGLMVKEDALVNPEDAFMSGPGRVQFFKQTANLQSDVREITPPQIPQSMFELQNMLDGEIMQIAGVNEELFGESASGTDPSGILNSQRMGAALVSLQGVFDKLNQSQKQVGEIFLDLIQANFSHGKMKKILGREPTQEFYHRDFQKYHCVVEEGQLTATQKQLQFNQALMLKQLGAPISWAYLLEKSQLQGKKDLMKVIEAEEKQAQEAQEAQMNLELQQQQAMNRSLEAKSQNDFASAEERMTRSVSNIGLAKEREAMAIQDIARANLENAQTLAELHEVDDNRLMKQVDFLMEMQLKQRQAEEIETNNTIAQTQNVTQSVESVKNSA